MLKCRWWSRFLYDNLLTPKKTYLALVKVRIDSMVFQSNQSSQRFISKWNIFYNHENFFIIVFSYVLRRWNSRVEKISMKIIIINFYFNGLKFCKAVKKNAFFQIEIDFECFEVSIFFSIHNLGGCSQIICIFFVTFKTLLRELKNVSLQIKKSWGKIKVLKDHVYVCVGRCFAFSSNSCP